jgi:hypothetical protein
MRLMKESKQGGEKIAIQTKPLMELISQQQVALA